MPREICEHEAIPVTRPPNHHFFGYYDKFPWNSTGRFMLGLETTFIDRPPAPSDVAVIGLIDTQDNYAWNPIAETHAWNWQQGTMLQWLPSAPDRLIIHNDRQGGQFVSVIRDIETGSLRVLPRPIYAVSRSGSFALTLNFARVHRTRPGYGYCGTPEPYGDDPHPKEDGIYWMDLETGESKLIISLAQIAAFDHDETMEGVKHWFNHLLVNHDDTRFIFLHRWKRKDGPGWYTRLFTANVDGSDIYCVNPDEMTSHFDWRNSKEILAWARQLGVGDRYYLFKDRSHERTIVGEDVFTSDGHCSYSPDGRWILTDEYPDKEHKRALILYRVEDNLRVDLGRFYSPPELSGEIRCDLHPRWSRDGAMISFDSAHEGHRQIYVMDISDLTK